MYWNINHLKKNSGCEFGTQYKFDNCIYFRAWKVIELLNWTSFNRSYWCICSEIGTEHKQKQFLVLKCSQVLSIHCNLSCAKIIIFNIYFQLRVPLGIHILHCYVHNRKSLALYAKKTIVVPRKIFRQCGEIIVSVTWWKYYGKNYQKRITKPNFFKTIN